MAILVDNNFIECLIIICWMLFIFSIALAHSTRSHEHSNFPTRVTKTLKQRARWYFVNKNFYLETKDGGAFRVFYVLCRMCPRSIPRPSSKHSCPEMMAFDNSRPLLLLRIVCYLLVPVHPVSEQRLNDSSPDLLGSSWHFSNLANYAVGPRLLDTKFCPAPWVHVTWSSIGLFPRSKDSRP